MDEQKWIETNNVVCALLRQAHDALAASSLPMKRPWVGLTVDEIEKIWGEPIHVMYSAHLKAIRDIETKLKEKNT